jgi:hypothetical protein
VNSTTKLAPVNVDRKCKKGKIERDKLSSGEKLMNTKPHFANFEHDHSTLHVDPMLYNVFYLLLRVHLCVPAGRDGIVYDVQMKWRDDHTESMTYAANLGGAWTDADEIQFQKLERIIGADTEMLRGFWKDFYNYFKQKREADMLRNMMLAVVQPSEPSDMFSHVRQILDEHSACAHVQHIALKTLDIREFYNHARARGAQFVTPLLYDEKNDLVQVFAGELYHPWIETPSGLFLEFVERRPNPELREEGARNRELFFRDKTFLSLYGYKQAEYESGNIVPYFLPQLFRELYALVGDKRWLDITEDDILLAEKLMMAKK